MASRFRMPLVTILAAIACCVASTIIWAQEPTPPAGRAQHAQAVQEAGLVHMTVKYERSMVVVVSKRGAAGVRFVEPFALGNKTGNGVVGVTYDWRFLPRRPGAIETTGSGRVFAKLVDGRVRDGSFAVQCGPIQLTWSHTDKRAGVVQYDPRQLAVHPVSGNYFEANKKQPHVKPIDLGRFLGPDKQPGAFRTAGPVTYLGSTLVVKDTGGIATFEFDDAFERTQGDNQTFYGVPYRFTFVSTNGETKEGAGEVYEKYTKGKYDQGELDLRAGPLRIRWSRGGDELGWIYYDPARNPIWCVHQLDAETLLNVITVRGRE